MENQLTPVNLISPLNSLNLVLIPGAKLDDHRGTSTGSACERENRSEWVCHMQIA